MALMLRVAPWVQVWEHMETRHSHPFQAMQVWDACGPGHIWLDAGEIGAPHMGTMVQNDVLQDACNACLESAPNVRFVRGAFVGSTSFWDNVKESVTDNASAL